MPVAGGDGGHRELLTRVLFLFSISEQESSPNCTHAQRLFPLFTPLGKKPASDRYLGTMSNPLHPKHMSAAERLDEIADILAAALIRLSARKSSGLSRDRGESSLDFSPDQSGHGVVQESVGDAE
jgi:hypothetical protein